MSTTQIKRKKVKSRNPSVILLYDNSTNVTEPVSLINLGKNKLLDIQIKCIRTMFDKSSEIILCLNLDGKDVSNYIKQNYRGENIKLINNKTSDSTNVEGLKMCLDMIDNDSILIINSSLLIYPEIIANIEGENFIIEQAGESLNLDIGIVKDENDNITNISYGLQKKWSEILYINNWEDIEKLRKECYLENSERKVLYEIINSSNITYKSYVNNFPLIKIIDNKTRNKIRKLYENINTELFVKFVQ